MQRPLEQLRASFAYGKIVHEGLTLAIVGRPNVGKSSLFNRLVERERAIVTSTPGTTRDLVTETVALGGIPIKLVDTAGIRLSTDEAESIGIRKSYEALSEADLVLVVLDSTQEISSEDKELLQTCITGRGVAVANKADLAPDATLQLDGAQDLQDLRGHGGRDRRAARRDPRAGFRPLRAGRTGNRLPHQHTPPAPGGRIAQQPGGRRPRRERSIPHEMIMLDLYGALRPLDAITGETTTDDILNLIFSSFCIGK